MPSEAPVPGSAARRALPLALLIAGCAALAWHCRFVQDDAFIAFRFASNLAAGRGLVYSPGERVEGYTDFLWTLLLAVPARLGWDLVRFSECLGVTLFVLSLGATWRVGLGLSGRRLVAYLAVALVGTNYTFLAYATGGLETQLQTLLYTFTLLLFLTGVRPAARAAAEPARQLALSVVAAAAVLTRLDSVLLVGPVVVVDLLRGWNPAFRVPHGARDGAADGAARALPGARAARTLRTLFPGALLVGGWLAWKTWYYGDVLPNTFYAKATYHTSAVRGTWYVGCFLALYFLPPALLVYVVRIGRLWGGREKLWGTTFWAVHLPPLLWMTYLVKVGGDFMEYRMMVPVAPVLYVAAAWALTEGIAARWLRWGLLAAMPAASLIHATTFSGSRLSRGIESIPDLRRHVASAQDQARDQAPDPGALPDWATVGRELGRLFPRHDVLIAVTPGGAIPYYSDLPTVDMLGLNDRWVARHGAHLSDRPGHQKIATLAYLRQRGVRLMVGHPQIHPAGEGLRPAYTPADLSGLFLTRGIPDPQNLPADARVLEVPLGPEVAGRRPAYVSVVYLTPDPIVDDVIARHLVRAVPITGR